MASVLADHEISPRQIDSSTKLSHKLGVYVHLPFCHSKCNFCDFATVVGQESKIDSYLNALEKEMSLRGAPLAETSGNEATLLATLFLGGGTPTVLAPAQIDRLFYALHKYFLWEPITEATVEANPESSSSEVLAAYKRNGINRISFGLQSTEEHLLRGLGRKHTFQDFLIASQRARRLGLNNVNVDLMFGLPDQTDGDWEKTLRKIIQLDPEHISTYALKVEEGTKFNKQALQPDEDREAAQYLVASQILKQAGYLHYEISNFAKPGFQSHHNLKYWRNEDTLGLGVSAASYLGGRRYKNTNNLIVYMMSLSKNNLPIEEERILSPDERRSENIMLALRLKEGIPADDIPAPSKDIFQQFLRQKLARLSRNRYQLTPQGWLLSNQLFQTLV